MLDWMADLFNKFGEWLLTVLPTSPFSDYIDKLEDIPYLGWLNWFIPVGDILKIFAAFLTAVALFYCYMIVARWVKLLGD